MPLSPLRYVPLLLYVLTLKPVLALDAPDHAQWQASMNAAQRALKMHDYDALKSSVLGVFKQSIRMGDTDARVAKSDFLFTRAFPALQAHYSHAEYIAFLKRMNALTRVRGGLASQVSWTPTYMLDELLLQDRNYAGARDLVADFAARATRDFGPTYPAARRGRQAEASAAAAMGDYERAAQVLDHLSTAVKQTYGSDSPEYVEVLLARAGLQAEKQDYAKAASLADKAAALIRSNGGMRVPFHVTLSLAQTYDNADQFKKARNGYYYVTQVLKSARQPIYQTTEVPVLTRLAYIDARLGNGSAARSDMAKAITLAHSLESSAPTVMMEALASQVSLYGFAGLYDKAVASIKLYQHLAKSSGFADKPATRRSIASSYLNAHRYREALAEGEALLHDAKQGSVDYFQDAELVALAGAQTKPPQPHVRLAKQVVAWSRKQHPDHEPRVALYVLALNYAAEGHWKKSAQMQQQIIDHQTKEKGRYEVSWTQWRSYASALEHTHNKAQATRIMRQLDAEIEPLRLALQDAASPGVALQEKSPFGFSVALTDDKWLRRSDTRTGFPLSTFVVAHYPKPDRIDATLMVLSVPLPAGVVSDTVIDGLLPRFGTDRASLTPWFKGPLAGYEYRTVRDVSGRRSVYFGRFIVQHSAVFVLAAVTDSGDSRAAAAVKAAFDEISFSGAVDPKQFGAADRKRYAAVLNIVGNGLSGNSNFKDALALYKAARRFDAENKTVAANIVWTDLQLGDYEAVRKEVNRYPGDLKASPNLLSWRAFSNQVLGDDTAAIADYGAAFTNGYRNDDYAAEYVNLLTKHSRDAEAAAFLDKYAAVKLTPNVLALEALVDSKLGDEQKLEDTLKKLEDPAHSNPQVALVGAMVRLRHDGVNGLAALVSRLARVKLTSAATYLLLARAQLAAGHLAQASSAVDDGLKLAPNDAALNAMKNALLKKKGTSHL